MSARNGFTLVELLVTISIIAILSVIGITIFTSAQNAARYAKVQGDFNAIHKNIEQARVEQHRTLREIIGSGCTDCIGCRSNDWDTCLRVMKEAYRKITSAVLPIDPWGHPYMFDENEYQFLQPENCSPDGLRTVGPDGLYGTSDDKGMNIPITGFHGC